MEVHINFGGKKMAVILRKQIWLRCKIPKVSAGAGMFQRSFLKRLFLEGLYAEGLIYGGKSALQNRLGKLICAIVLFLLCFISYLRKFLEPLAYTIAS